MRELAAVTRIYGPHPPVTTRQADPAAAPTHRRYAGAGPLGTLLGRGFAPPESPTAYSERWSQKYRGPASSDHPLAGYHQDEMPLLRSSVGRTLEERNSP